MRNFLEKICRFFSNNNFLAIASLIIALSSSIFTYMQYNIANRAFYSHINPELSFNLSAYKKQNYFQPIIKIKNSSPINIVSLTSDFILLQYNKNRKKFHLIPNSALIENQVIKEHLIFEKNLDPNGFIYSELGMVISTDSKDSVFIFIIFSTYYRQTDMEEFKKKKIYFFENGKFIDQRDYLEHPEYKKLFTYINSLPAPTFSDVSLRQTPFKIGEKAKINPKTPAAPSGIRMMLTD